MFFCSPDVRFKKGARYRREHKDGARKTFTLAVSPVALAL